MKRKMIGAAAAYMSGLFFVSFLNKGSDLLLLAGLFSLFFLFSVILKISLKDTIFVSVFFISAVIIGTSYKNLVYEKIISFSDSSGNFSGKIISIENYDNNKSQYTLKGTINNAVPAKINVFSDSYKVNYGDIMTLENCYFKIPEKDYLFDNKSYLKSHEIFLNINSQDEIIIEHKNSYKLMNSLINYREKMISQFKMKLNDDNGDFLSGIIFGETSGFSTNQKAVMYRSGIGHILAVSGLHVSIIAALLMNLMNTLHINKYVSLGLMNVFIFLMIIIVKAPVSVIRAAIMLNFIYFAKIFRRQNDVFNSLSAAILIICIINPFSIYDIGFILSVAGTFGVGVFAPYMTREMKTCKLYHKLFKGFISAFCVTLFVMPLNMLFFDETSLVSPVTNIIIIPLCLIAMLIGILYILTGGYISLLSIADIIVDAVMFVINKLGRLSVTHFSCGSKKLFVISLFCVLFIVLVKLIFKSRKFIALALTGSIFVFIFTSSLYSNIEHERFKIAVLGKGANAAVVISYKGRTDIIDLSGHYKTTDYVRKYLLSGGIAEVSSLAITKKVQSQYSSYINSLELIDVNEIILFDSKKLDTFDENNIVYSQKENFMIYCNEYTICFDTDCLTITYGKAKVTIMPIKSKKSSNNSCLTVFYGNIPQEYKIIYNDNSIYLDAINGVNYQYADINNFEITATAENGNCSIRRL